MLSALLRPFRGSSSRADDQQPVDLEQDFAFRPSIAEYRRHLHATADFTEADDDDEDESDGAAQPRAPSGGRPDDEDGMARSSGILPLFSANNLDAIPVFSITHAIRDMVQTRTETALSWEQLRSPQISQFLVKPMQQQIRAQHFSPATLYALMANCLQFEKESRLSLGTAGTNATRARVCQLLAIKLLKEYSTRELIDALCYDFYPLQGCSGTQTPLAPGGSRPLQSAMAPRTSALEVAIRASAKHFLAHPLVVQYLEAIWNGFLCFSVPAHEPGRLGSSGSVTGSIPSRRHSTVRTPLLGDRDQRTKYEPPQSKPFTGRCSVRLYDPRSASLFKLSRLRVPRYRRLFSTCSLLILIGLFLAVLGQRSSRITSVELVFWIWSAGFMLDELVGFSEQGLSFYVMSFWNIFDLGILVLLMVYYCMRIYGVFLLDPHQWNQNAYDVLAVNAVLLLPRVIGILDHHRSFSRLLISLRLLMLDLGAIFVLAFICCGGFFVFFAFSKNPDGPTAIAYKLFQALLGFTPSAWDMWSSYNWMGKTLLVLFLVMSHFVVIAILIAVLTNSLMVINSRATEEHQFTFAVNTMAMAKNDAPFCYAPPLNIFAWALMPLSYAMPRRQYVWLNHTVLRVTHFPLLFGIYFYEKFILACSMYESTDLVDRPQRARRHALSDPASRSTFFSPSIRIREESVVAFERERALEEVFRRVPNARTQRRNDRHKTQTAIRTWMDQHEPSPRNYSTMNSTRMGSDWQRRLSMNRERPSRIPRHYSDIRSTASDPADIISEAPYPIAAAMYDFDDGIMRRDYTVEPKVHTDAEADGDDELVTNDEDEGDDATNNLTDRGANQDEAIEDEDYFTPVGTRFSNPELESPRPPTSRHVPLHTRTMSTNTILYAPESTQPDDSSASDWPTSRPFSRPMSSRHTPVATPITAGAGRRSPRRHMYLAANRPRSMIQPGESLYRTMPGRSGGLTLDIAAATNAGSASTTRPLRRHSVADLLTTSSAYPETSNHNREPMSSGSADDVNRTLLAKMQSLEESLGFMFREMRSLARRHTDGEYHSDETGKPSSWGRSLHHHPHPHHHHYRDYQQQQRQRRAAGGGFSVGSDPSSTRGQALIEVAMAQARERERDREREGGRVGPAWLRRARTAAAAAAVSSGGGANVAGGSGSGGVVSRRSLPPRRPLGVWRSSGSGSAAVVGEDKLAAASGSGTGGPGSGLGITGRTSGSGHLEERKSGGKGKGRERDRDGDGRGSRSPESGGGRGDRKGSLDTVGLMAMSPQTDGLSQVAGKGGMSL
ncbi:hypothetical protein VTJ83DRAFT_4879 [Remersonia thermophila]|uniref:Ion transport domain-containing protein n=1 Tax=Remersonia thermophila TaxID=72144 RepID=A0ABR4DDE1_9PEZI